MKVLRYWKDIESLTPKEAEKIYRQYRSAFNKRIKRAEKRGEDVTEFKKGGRMEFKSLTDLYTKTPYLKGASADVKHNAVLMYVKELSGLLDDNSGYRNVVLSKADRKQRRQEISERLENVGIHIAPSQVGNFGRFMDALRKEYNTKKLPVSEEAAEFFESLKYRVKNRSTKSLVDLFGEFMQNGFEPNDTNLDLFAT